MWRDSTRMVLVVLVAMSLSCARNGLEPRFVAVHNAMSAMGLAQTGPISEGSLSEGDEARFPTTMTSGQCYMVVAFASSGVNNVDLVVLDPSGNEVGRDATADRQATVQACAQQTGPHQVVLVMADGDGSYALSSWSGAGVAGRSSGSGPTAGTGPGSCSAPIPLAVGQLTQGSTQGAPHSMQGPCAPGSAGERVYRFRVDERSAFSAELESEYDGSLYVLRNCGDVASTVVCNDDAGSTARSSISTQLDAGEYYLVVDGYGDASGSFSLTTSASPLRSLAAVCADAEPLTLGQPITGTTSGAIDYFQATCADGAQSPDQVYRFDVDQPSRFRARQQSDHDGALHLRTTCDQPTTEIACNDDHVNATRSVITTRLEPGTYYLYSDGYGNGQTGDYTLITDLTSTAGTGAPGDSCTDRAMAPIGQLFEADTFRASNAFSGSCGGEDAPDVSYRIQVQSARARLRATLREAEFPAVMYVQRTCGDSASEVACFSTASGSAPAVLHGGFGTSEPQLETVLTRGEYVLVIDGERGDVFGAAQVSVELEDLDALERACRGAPVLRPNRETRGSTSNQQDNFQATCAAGARSADTLYRIRLNRRSRIRVAMDGTYDGALHLRRECLDSSTELACNDDEGDNRHSLIETTLDRGVYYLVVDGFGQGSTGDFTVDFDVSQP